MESRRVGDDREVLVVLVERKDAKKAKTKLTEVGLIHKSYRLTPTATSIDTIAIPLIENDHIEADVQSCLSDDLYIIGFGRQKCPLSTALLGNSNQIRCLPNSDGPTTHETLVQNAITNAVWKYWSELTVNKIDKNNLQSVKEELLTLDNLSCPKSLQYLGDDKTLVIPLRAFDIQRDESFHNFVSFVIRGRIGENGDVTTSGEYFLSKFLWEALALVFNSPRVVRRGEIDPNSKIRLSEYKILWTTSDRSAREAKKVIDPMSAGWITITEQGIRQSFDLTKVMFSRGNITEKIRFGEMVQPEDVVLDMYAGIGYFTLPALVHGGAELVVCCEWNEEAVKALKYNLQDNGVSHRAQVLVGDCRDSAKENNLVDMFDRVSLGLLPSSEGGWRTGVRALRKSTGGWLHVHGNVPVKEVDDWALWMCSKLKTFAIDECFGIDVIVVVVHIEKVKSFAPTVNHYVADVFIGSLPQFIDDKKRWYRWNQQIVLAIQPGFAGVIQKGGSVVDSENTGKKVPSCALTPGGPIYKEWMTDKE